jgi:adenylate cyclase
MRWFAKPTARRKARRRTRFAATGAAALLLFACAFAAWEGSFEPVNLAWQGQLFEYRHQAGLDPKRAPIVIVAWDQNTYDDPSLNGEWDRATTARLVDILHKAGARLIMIDRLYESSGVAGSTALAASMRKAGNVVIAQELILSNSSLTNSTGLEPLDPSIAAAARASGLVNIPSPETADPNARYRAYLNDFEWSQGQFKASFALAGARLLGGKPAGKEQDFLINFVGPIGSFPFYSMRDVLHGDPGLLSSLSGKIVLVGDDLSTDKDYIDTPMQSLGAGDAYAVQDKMYGIEYNANALNTILEQNPLRRPDTPGQIALTFPLAIIAAIWSVRGRLYSSLLVAGGLICLLLAGAWFAFVWADTWIDPAAPLLATVVTPLAVLGVRYTTEERANREVRSLFGRYVAPSVVSRIVDDPDAFGLEGELREITVLFSDIRGFTTLSEGMDPTRIVRMLSRYFTAMVEEIQGQGGTVDKYVGDAIMALFGAPEDQPDAPVRAVRAALGMQRRLAALNAELAEMVGKPIETGIGLHHGPAAVGVIGAPSKREYSAIGDTVNTASRLEGLTKDVGYAIVAGETVIRALPSDLAAEVGPQDLGEVTVKGKAGAVRVFGLGPPVNFARHG